MSLAQRDLGPTTTPAAGSAYNHAVLARLRLGVLRLLRLNTTPHGVALGFTLGLGLSLFPIPFLGMIVALAVAPLVGASIPAVYAGTAVVNPLTGAAIYFGELWLGGRLIGERLPAWVDVRDYDWREWWALFRARLPSFLLGAVVSMIGAAILAYPSLRWLVSAYQRRHPRKGDKPSAPLAGAADGHQNPEGEHHRDHVGAAVGEEGQRQAGVGEELEDHADVEDRVP